MVSSGGRQPGRPPQKSISPSSCRGEAVPQGSSALIRFVILEWNSSAEIGFSTPSISMRLKCRGRASKHKIFSGSVTLKCLRVSWTRFVRSFPPRILAAAFPLAPALRKCFPLRMESRVVVCPTKRKPFPIAPLSLPLSFLVAVLCHRDATEFFSLLGHGECW